MATIDKNTIYSWFQTDAFPTEEQFRATWDSFWHKSESIPMSQITGLNQLFQQTATVAQLNDKANVDGSNIDVSAYQEKLNITNLIATAKEEVKTELLNGAPEAFDTLKEISDWISDDGTAEAAILQAIQNEAIARTNADNLKLDKPLSPNNTNQHVIMGDGSTKPAGDLGKNFFNSDLNNTTARNHTMNAGVTINTLGNPYSLTGLPNKEADPSFNKAIRINSSGQLGLGDTQQFNITVPDVITSNNNLSIAPLTVNHIYPNPVPNITTYVQDLQNIMATIGNLNFIKMSNWVVNTNNPTNSSQLIAGDGLVSFNLGYSQSAYDGFPVASVASQANLFPANKNFVIFFNISATVFGSRWGIVLAGMSQSDDNTSIIVPTLAYAGSNSSNSNGWSSGSQENILSNGQNGSVFIVKSGQVIFVVICNNSTGQKVVASFDANVNGGDYRFVATMIQKDVGSSQPLPLTEIKYWIAP